MHVVFHEQAVSGRVKKTWKKVYLTSVIDIAMWLPVRIRKNIFTVQKTKDKGADDSVLGLLYDTQRGSKWKRLIL